MPADHSKRKGDQGEGGDKKRRNWQASVGLPWGNCSLNLYIAVQLSLAFPHLLYGSGLGTDSSLLCFLAKICILVNGKAP